MNAVINTELLTTKAWNAVEREAEVIGVRATNKAAADIESDDGLLEWVDSCEDGPRVFTDELRSAVLDYIAIRCGGEGIDPADYAEAIQNVTGDARMDPDTAAALLQEFDARFGDAVAEDAEIDAGDAVDWISEFAPRVRAALNGGVS